MPHMNTLESKKRVKVSGDKIRWQQEVFEEVRPKFDLHIAEGFTSFLCNVSPLILIYLITDRI